MSKTNERIKRARELTGMSVGQASRFAKGAISKERILELEASSDPSNEEVEILSDVYHVNTDWLTGGFGNKDASLPPQVMSYLGEEDVARVIELLRARKNHD
jgi:transcriptional regulator with XRE-family HTH domain